MRRSVFSKLAAVLLVLSMMLILVACDKENKEESEAAADYDLTDNYDLSESDKTFDKAITVKGSNGKIMFSNCTFNGNLTLTGGEGAIIFLLNCTFSEKAECYIRSTFEEGTIETTLPKFIIIGTMPAVTVEKAGAVVTTADTVIKVNGKEYALENAEYFIKDDGGYNVENYENQEADMHNVAMWVEKGEKVVAHYAVQSGE